MAVDDLAAATDEIDIWDVNGVTGVWFASVQPTSRKTPQRQKRVGPGQPPRPAGGQPDPRGPKGVLISGHW